MQTITLYKVCTQCNTTGEFTSGGGETPSTTISCPWPGCEGTGYVELGRVTLDPGLNDVIDKCNDIIDKCNDILNEL